MDFSAHFGSAIGFPLGNIAEIERPRTLNTRISASSRPLLRRPQSLLFVRFFVEFGASDDPAGTVNLLGEIAGILPLVDHLVR